MGERMRNILLLSTSVVYGSGYLEYCREEITRFLSRSCKKVLFIPFAGHDYDEYTKIVRGAYSKLGYDLVSIHETDNYIAAIESADALFVGGGNSFRLLNRLYEYELLDAIRSRALSGMPYIGTSAGSNVACLSIKTTNDMPIIYPPSFDALALVSFNLNPHYLDASPQSTHMGETRETRIKEFHEVNDVPVVGLREGSLLQINGNRLTLKGKPGAKLFRRGKQPHELKENEPLDYLL